MEKEQRGSQVILKNLIEVRKASKRKQLKKDEAWKDIPILDINHAKAAKENRHLKGWGFR